MAAVFRVGAGALVESRFQPDVLEEIRIMAEAAQASLMDSAAPATANAASFFQLLGQVLLRPRLH